MNTSEICNQAEHATDTTSSSANLEAHIDAACERACQMIAPAWPLDRAIAVNPHWSRIHMPLRQVAARMAVLGDMAVLPSRATFQEAWQTGRIDHAQLTQAIQTVAGAKAAGLTAQTAIQALQIPPAITRLPLLIDVLDTDPLRHTRLPWRQAITHQVSQTCAAYFDEQQADWQPQREKGLYAFWRDTLQHDHGIGVLMGLPKLGLALKALPATRQDAQRWMIERLGLAQTAWADYLEAVLLTVNGWASWCAYLGWVARLDGKQDEHLRDLLAIRLAWGALLLECKGQAAGQAFEALQQAWRHSPAVLAQAQDALIVDEVWQVALELGYQGELAQQLRSQPDDSGASQDIEVQAAFCIDVRSEPLRRALETAMPQMQTIGFAGFFGLPVAYTPLGTQARRPQLPGLLAASVEVGDRINAAGGQGSDFDLASEAGARQARAKRFSLSAQWRAASRWPGAGFCFVESVGVGYLGKLWQWLRTPQHERINDDLAGLPARYRPVCRPHVMGLDVAAKAQLAANVLHAMGLDRQLAPLVLLVGHGSQSSNNAHAAALDCGACCGQTGQVNAQSLALLLNEAAVRSALKTHGITIPEHTWFIAALHNTTTDAFEAFDLDLLPPTARERWQALQSALLRASEQVRRERAPALGLNPDVPAAQLLAQLRRRANDGAQTRPEWGLAGNAAFLIAPRSRSRGLVLKGRSFLHDYDASQDADGSVLELLMTAPMLVTHWINFQYHASTCEPQRLGSGNKVLHNVVGGHIGVFEGNGGDLRIGLSHQSLHDGQRWMHEPLRLSVVIDAPQQAIERVIQKHAVLQLLLGNGWLHLWRFEQSQLEQYELGVWRALEL